MHVFHQRFAAGGQRSQHQRCSAAQIMRRHMCAMQPLHALNQRRSARYADVRAHAAQIARNGKAVFKHLFLNDACATAHTGQRKHLRLHIGWKTGMRLGLQSIKALQPLRGR